MNFRDFFHQATGGRIPLPYQARIADGPWPDLLDIPTGLGKTAAVGAAWLWKRLNGDANTGRRLVYCLPMRVLVEQTRDVLSEYVGRVAPAFLAAGQKAPTVHVLMGGFVDETWESEPEQPAILIGTQDMLLSRALNRGYAMSRFKWPVHFGLLNTDCLWVFDEVQLMGVAVETSAQLQGLRAKLGTCSQVHSIWASATLTEQRLDTVDHAVPTDGLRAARLNDTDKDHSVVRERIDAKKPLQRAQTRLAKGNAQSYPQQLATEVADLHRARGGLTLVVCNRVPRAQALHQALAAIEVGELGLVHSRFRPHDRANQETVLHKNRDRIVVATQALEAGVDVSARTLVTELAPWPSLVQRFGRCNRYGEQEDASVVVVDIETNKDPTLALPYESDAFELASSLLSALPEPDVSPRALISTHYEPIEPVRPLLRRRDLLGLFDTTSDLTGTDLDVSLFIRDGQDTDVHVYWRALPDDALPSATLAAPRREELCAVSVAAFADFLKKLKRARDKGKGSDSQKNKLQRRVATAHRWNAFEGEWQSVDRATPGSVVLLDARAGGYDSKLGWTGQAFPKEPVPVVPGAGTQSGDLPTDADTFDSDARSSVGRWVGLTDHLGHVEAEARSLVDGLTVPNELVNAVVTAARWHDVGKAHAEFQRRLIEPVSGTADAPPEANEPWAKSAHRRRAIGARPHFRHELASALAWLATHRDERTRETDLVGYLIAAHHGKVRLSIRSVPDEKRPPDPQALFARGVWQGDPLPPSGQLLLPTGESIGPWNLDLSVMRMGEGSWLERTLSLRDNEEIGPFRLAFLEAVVRVADWRASAKEAVGGYDE